MVTVFTEQVAGKDFLLFQLAFFVGDGFGVNAVQRTVFF
jgi:hypothetical protein